MQVTEKELKDCSFEVTEGTVETFDSWDEESIIDLNGILNVEDKSFEISNDVVAYVMNGKYFAAWHTRKLMGMLEELGFHRNDELYVPFSYNSYPKGSLSIWNDLKDQADKERLAEAEEACEAWFEEEFSNETAEQTE